jgi:hypothetical protein
MMKLLVATGIILLLVALGALILLCLPHAPNVQPISIVHCKQGETYAPGGCKPAFPKVLTP